MKVFSGEGGRVDVSVSSCLSGLYLSLSATYFEDFIYPTEFRVVLYILFHWSGTLALC